MTTYVLNDQSAVSISSNELWAWCDGGFRRVPVDHGTQGLDAWMQRNEMTSPVSRSPAVPPRSVDHAAGGAGFSHVIAGRPDSAVGLREVAGVDATGSTSESRQPGSVPRPFSKPHEDCQ